MTVRANHGRHSGIRSDVSALRVGHSRKDADRRVRVLLRMQWLQGPLATYTWALLRFLYLRIGGMSTEAAGRDLLFLTIAHGLHSREIAVGASASAAADARQHAR